MRTLWDLRRIGAAAALLAVAASPVLPDAAMRQAAGAYVVRERLLMTARSLREDRTYDVMVCTDYPVVPGQEEDTPAVVRLAVDQVILRNALKRIGYPPAVVDAAVDQWERDKARSGDEGNAAGDALARRLNAWRKANGNRVRPITNEGGCGGAESAVKFDLQPNGRIFLIPAFYFAVCKARGVDPYDRRRCDGWGEVFEGRETFLSGDYAYDAVWSGGRMRRGTMRLEGSPDEGDAPTIVLRPAG